jgi:hypothetical protein
MGDCSSASRPVTGAADIVLGSAWRDIARAEAVDGKSAHELRPAKEAAHKRQRLPAIGHDVSALRAHQADDVIAEVMVVAHVPGGPQEIRGTGESGHVLAELPRRA